MTKAENTMRKLWKTKAPTPRPEISARLNRRGELRLHSGIIVKASFGRQWKPSKGPERQIVKAIIDGNRYSGIAVQADDTVRLFPVTRNRDLKDAKHERP